MRLLLVAVRSFADHQRKRKDARFSKGGMDRKGHVLDGS